MRRAIQFSLIFTILTIVSCQSAPTRVRETRSYGLSEFTEKSQRPLKLDENTVILDVRSEFDYGLKHVAGSIRFGWEDLVTLRQTGEMLQSQRELDRRLTLVGLSPHKPVVVLGNGLRGLGEEGRLAWHLMYLGFEDVQVSELSPFEKLLTTEVPSPRENSKSWEIKPRTDWVITSTRFRNLAHDPVGRRSRGIVLIDVRSANEYFNKAKGAPKLPDFHALNMEWKQFYTEQGRVNFNMRRQLQSLKIEPQNEIIVYSQRGVRAAAVAYALMAMGYRQVGVFRLSSL